MIQGLKTRFRNLIDKKEIAVGQFLDPRLKDRQTEFPDFFRQKVFSYYESGCTPIPFAPVHQRLERTNIFFGSRSFSLPSYADRSSQFRYPRHSILGLGYVAPK
uniref:Uncharacterized protein n=1 Tax=Globodera rostochiensis TaxID=31243 RepID=A0A914HZW1_GLORO